MGGRGRGNDYTRGGEGDFYAGSDNPSAKDAQITRLYTQLALPVFINLPRSQDDKNLCIPSILDTFR